MIVFLFLGAGICAGQRNTEADLVWMEDILPGLAPILQGAEEQSPRLLAQNLNILQARGNSVVASAPLYPEVSGRVTRQRQTAKQDRWEEWRDLENTNYSLSASQALYHWGALQAASAIGRERERMSRETYENILRLLLLDLRRQYADLAVMQFSRRKARLDFEVSSRRHTVVEGRAARGEASDAELATSRLAFDEARLQFDRSEVLARRALEDFRILSGQYRLQWEDIPYFPIERVEFAEEQPLVPSEANLGRLLANSVELQRLRSDLTIEALNRRIIDVALRPKLNLNAGYSVGQDAVNLITTRSLFINVGVVWNIFDGRRSRGQRMASQARQRHLDQQVELTREQEERWLARMREDIDLSLRDTRLRLLRYESAQSSLEFYREQASRGLVSEERVLQEEAGFAQAAQIAARQQVQLLHQLATLGSACGLDPLLHRSSSNLP